MTPVQVCTTCSKLTQNKRTMGMRAYSVSAYDLALLMRRATMNDTNIINMEHEKRRCQVHVQTCTDFAKKKKKSHRNQNLPKS